MRNRVMGVCGLALVSSILLGAAQVRHAPPVRLIEHDLQGQPVKVFPAATKRGVVVFYVLAGTQDETRNAPEMKRIAQSYARKGWTFYLFYVGGGIYSPRARIEGAKAMGYPFPVLQAGDLPSLGKVTLSPESAIFSPKGALLYHGRFDDAFDAAGRSNRGSVTHYLSQALDEIDSGRPVSPTYVAPVGSYIPMD